MFFNLKYHKNKGRLREKKRERGKKKNKKERELKMMEGHNAKNYIQLIKPQLH